MTVHQKKNLTILLVEDNSADAVLTSETLSDSTIPTEVHVTKDAAEAFVLLGRNGNAGKYMPDLILLDLNLPVMDGFSFLGEIRNHNHLKEIPVFILSASSTLADMTRAHSLGVKGYFVKPLDLSEFETEIRKHFKDTQFG